MKDKIRIHKEKVVAHVKKNRGKYAASVTLVAVVAFFNHVDRKAQWDQFLKDQDLFEEYYTPENSY
jgi:hypothetical protein